MFAIRRIPTIIRKKMNRLYSENRDIDSIKKECEELEHKLKLTRLKREYEYELNNTLYQSYKDLAILTGIVGIIWVGVFSIKWIDPCAVGDD